MYDNIAPWMTNKEPGISGWAVSDGLMREQEEEIMQNAASHNWQTAVVDSEVITHLKLAADDRPWCKPDAPTRARTWLPSIGVTERRGEVTA